MIDGAELWVRQHVRPGRGRRLAGPQGDDVLASVQREAAEAVRKHEVTARELDGALALRHDVLGWRERWHRLLDAAALDLLGERPGAVDDHNAGDGLLKDPVLLRHLVGVPDEDAARPVDDVRLRSGGDEPHDLVVQLLAVAGRLLVPDDEVDCEPGEAPVRMCLDELPHQFDLRSVADAQEDDRQVAGDAEAPEAGLRAPVAGEDVRRGTAARVGVDDRAGEAAVELGVRLGRVELAEDDLPVGRRQIEDAVGQTAVVVLAGERHRRLACLADAGHHVHPDRLIRTHRNLAADRDDRVKHRPLAVGKAGVVRHRFRVGERPAAPDEARPVRLE